MNHVLWGTASSTCGEDNTLNTFLIVGCLVAILGSLAAAVATRGKLRAAIDISSTRVAVSTRRSTTVVRWNDVVAARVVGPREASWYARGSLVLKARRFERVEVNDVCRDGCWCFGCCTCWDLDIGCGVGYARRGVREGTKERAARAGAIARAR